MQKYNKIRKFIQVLNYIQLLEKLAISTALPLEAARRPSRSLL